MGFIDQSIGKERGQFQDRRSVVEMIVLTSAWKASGLRDQAIDTIGLMFSRVEVARRERLFTVDQVVAIEQVLPSV